MQDHLHKLLLIVAALELFDGAQSVMSGKSRSLWPTCLHQPFTAKEKGLFAGHQRLKLCFCWWSGANMPASPSR
jgi:hypothetical protein